MSSFVCATALLLADVSSISFPWFIGEFFWGSRKFPSPPQNECCTYLTRLFLGTMTASTSFSLCSSQTLANEWLLL